MNDDEKNPYAGHWPEGRGDANSFSRCTEEIISDYLGSDDPKTSREISRELKRLRSAVANLSPEARRVIHDREIDQWQNARPEGAEFDSEYTRRVFGVAAGGTALDTLEGAVAKDFKRTKARDAVKRQLLLIKAAMIFKTTGGEIEARVKSPFVAYIEHLFEDVGMDYADCPKAIRYFLEENSWVKE